MRSQQQQKKIAELDSHIFRLLDIIHVYQGMNIEKYFKKKRDQN